ncbi:hypothetical protein [Streptomyces sp. G1]|uniref:hypothetical protein n=1 Tax=Streptomyces sp. G1 TaxID=361572 RepID=UPI00202E6378|nr:hypothetical protein [Streptomyces sp. G1]MCM1972309.1 hypothetical protein [Streptomyces sp. G1]
MVRHETHCDGRLVKEVEQVDVSTSDLRDQFIDGRHIWLLDGTEVTEADAETFRATWADKQTSTYADGTA